MPATAEYTFEVETDLTGSYDRGSPSVGDPPGWEGTACDGLFAIKRDRSIRDRTVWVRTDLLAGLSAEARLIVEENVRKFIGDDEVVAALAEAA